MTKPTIRDVQFISRQDGHKEFAVVPIELWNDMVNGGEREDDDISIPHEVVDILIEKNVSMLAAWRLHKGFSQEFMATQLGCTQGAVAQAEEKGKRPRNSTLEKWAEIFGCEWEQLKEI